MIVYHVHGLGSRPADVPTQANFWIPCASVSNAPKGNGIGAKGS